MNVLYHGKPYKVYGVCTDRCEKNTLCTTYADFLIFKKNCWRWVSSYHCTPYKKKKHKKKGCKEYQVRT